MTNKKRVLLIGLDGFTWRLGRGFMADGVMPVLGRLAAGGCSGALQSVIPFETAPAWSSFQTGCLPGKTGVFTFHTYDRRTGRIRLNSFSDIAVASLWELASGAGRTVASLNLPVTSPPPRVNGIIIPGLLCPGLSKATVHPGWAYARYIKPHSDYAAVCDKPSRSAGEFAKECAATERRRCDVALAMMRDLDWDVFCFQVQCSDVVQHRLWWALDPSADGFSEREHRDVVMFYSACDDIIAQLIGAAGEETLTVILSDHGFCREAGRVHVNAWLRKNGYLNLPPEKRTRWDAVKDAVLPLKVAARLAGSCARVSRDLLKGAFAGPRKLKPFNEIQLQHLRRLIDLEATQAFCLGGPAGLLYIRAEGDRKADLGRMLTERLLNDFGPRSEHPVITKILPAAEVYGPGGATATMPDLVLYFEEGYAQIIHPLGEEIVTLHQPGTRQPGLHDRNGVIVLSGPDVKRGAALDGQIVDIAPTVLAYLGIAVPRHMDGKVLDGFSQPLGAHYEDVDRSGTASTDYTDEEQAAVERNLTDLGYL